MSWFPLLSLSVFTLDFLPLLPLLHSLPQCLQYAIVVLSGHAALGCSVRLLPLCILYDPSACMRLLPASEWLSELLLGQVLQVEELLTMFNCKSGRCFLLDQAKSRSAGS